MFALHWIFALTLALVSCLSAKPVNSQTKEILMHISTFNSTIEGVTCAEDVRLYAPSQITEECIPSALNCTIEELKVLKFECNITDSVDIVDDDDAVKKDNPFTTSLRIVLNDLTEYPKMKKWSIPTNPNPNCSCEKFEETDLETFLKNVKDQVQQFSSMN